VISDKEAKYYKEIGTGQKAIRKAHFNLAQMSYLAQVS
jgi:hypothetical protein